MDAKSKPWMQHAAANLLARQPLPLRQFEGTLTQDLVLSPGLFGLGQVPSKLRPDATTEMTCGFCSTGCSLNVHLHQGQAINVTPSVNHPVNTGMACPKGWESLAVLNATDRATTPLMRDQRGKLTPINWSHALDLFYNRMRCIQEEHGNEAVAFLSTGQIPTEEMAFLGALAKFGMGMIHGDGNTRQCMATAVVAYKEAFGFDAPPYTYQDFEESDVVVLVGANLCIAHPIMWQRILKNRHAAEIIVVDPRRTETAAAATQHVALKPKSDLTLFYGLARLLIERGWIDRTYINAHTNGFPEFAQHVQSFTPEQVETVSGVTPESLDLLATKIHQGKRVSFWWTMGVNQSYEGVRTAQALINLALITGNIGRPGTGANSITGQCNAMGSRLYSNTTNLLGGRDFENAEHRQQVADVLEIDVANIPSQPSWSYDRIIEGILRGKIKSLWVIGTNPSHSWINQNTYREILSRLDFLVVQDMYHTTETAQGADLFFPAAGWGEKDGTFINSERRIGVIKKVARAPGQALADFSIFRAVADRWGCAELFRNWQQPEDVFESLKQLSSGQPCDMSGIRDYQMLDISGGVQWPFSMADAQVTNEQLPISTNNQRRLFEDGKFYHADGRAQMLFENPRSMPESPNPRYPFLLLTGRGSATQWHTQTRTSKSAVLNKLHPTKAYVEINPLDARRMSIRSEQTVLVESQRGQVLATAFVTRTVQPGQVFIPMHYPEANRLTHAHFDPYSRQPSYKDCAVLVRPKTSHDSV